LCWVNLATYQDTSPYLLPLTFASHYTLIPLNPEEPKKQIDIGDFPFLKQLNLDFVALLGLRG